MKKFLISSILATLLFAENPSVYSALGDMIYDNVDAIEKLKEIDEFSAENKEIDTYIDEVKKAKIDGFKIESCDDSINKDKYLAKLRELSKTNDNLQRSTKNSFKQSIDNENSELFYKLINTGLIDIQAYKQEIVTYYLQHRDDINASGAIENLINEHKALKKQNEENIAIKDDNKELKIKRMREKDREKQEIIKKSLEDELIQKKKEIRKNQRNELSDN